MPVGDVALPPFETVKGVRIGTASAGIKTPGRQDLTVFELAEGSQVAGVFTSNAFCAAPVTVAREHLAKQKIRYLVINSGNANAGNGLQGLEDARRSCEALAEAGACRADQVLPFSTGVIGEALPVDKLVAAMPAALEDLSERGWAPGAHAIMTTDVCAKGATTIVETPAGQIAVSGMSKGAGMIRPDMATMLAFVATDAALPQARLEALLKRSVNASFNRISVDGDTSTNDACMLIATGQSVVIDEGDEESLGLLEQAITDVMVRLATLIVRDGEGATKFISLQVEEARNTEEALQVAYTVAHSPLVKTAFFASDANWGRLLMAVGRAGLESLDVDKVSLYLDEVCIVDQGGRAASYTEDAGQTVMNREEITVRICLGRGEESACVWTTDLSHEYVRINAEYRT